MIKSRSEIYPPAARRSPAFARPLRTAGLMLLSIVAVAVAGCTDSTTPEQLHEQVLRGGRSHIFDSFARNLNQLEQADNHQILELLRNQLNQWTKRDNPTADWERDAMLDGLPEELRASVNQENLTRSRYEPADAHFLQETVWLRDAAKTAASEEIQPLQAGEQLFSAVGGELEPLRIAERLFDWTVRNLDPEPARSGGKGRWLNPSEIMVLGRATPLERAWIFILLARQQRLDAVMLAVGETVPRPWLPAVAISGQYYLFDTELGLPVPGNKPGSIATLAEAKADEALLRKLDLGEKRYRVKAADLKHVTALIEASPQYLSQRMKLIEAYLTGKQRVVLSTSPSAVAARLAKAEPKLDAQLWTYPFSVEQHRAAEGAAAAGAFARDFALLDPRVKLWGGRVRHLKGQFDGDGGAKQFYMGARISNADIEHFNKNPDEMVGTLLVRNMNREQLEQMIAKMTRGMSATDREAVNDDPERHLGPMLAGRLDPELRKRLVRQNLEALSEAKLQATYWLGVMANEQGDTLSAIDFLSKRLLEINPSSNRAAGARYNLARTYEAAGKLDQAIALYEADTSPQSVGNRLRARLLREKQGATPAAAPKAAAR